MKADEILKKGAEILKQRGAEYETTGESERSFQAVADCFNAKTGKFITAAEVALLLQDLKDVRQWSQDRLHEDSVIDCVNYAALKGGELYKQYDDFAQEFSEICGAEAYNKNNSHKNTKLSLAKFFELGFELVVGDEVIDAVGNSSFIQTKKGASTWNNQRCEDKNRFVSSLAWRETEYYANRANLIETRGKQWRPNLQMLIELHGE